MLNKMLPDQISRFWDQIKYAVEQSLPPISSDHPDRINRVLAAALGGTVDVWASYTREEEKIKFEGIILTKILYDDVSDTRNLLIYCVYGYVPISKESWLEGLVALTKYARSENCLQIIAYTNVPFIVDKAKYLGAECVWNFISFSVDKLMQSYQTE